MLLTVPVVLRAAKLFGICIVFQALPSLPVHAQSGCQPNNPSTQGTQAGGDVHEVTNSFFPAPPAQRCDVTVTVPQGRRFVILSVGIIHGYWKNHVGYCFDHPCSSITGTLSVIGPSGQPLIDPISATADPRVDANLTSTNSYYYCTQEPECTTAKSKLDQDTLNCMVNPPGPAYDACVQAARDKYNAAIANLRQDYWILGYNAATDRYTKIIDVSSMTGTGPITITMRGTTVGTTYSWPIAVTATLFGDTRFTMTQTPSTFRPRDARDPAADCTNHAGDCHISFQAQFVYGPLDPSQSASVGGQSRRLWAAAMPPGSAWFIAGINPWPLFRTSGLVPTLGRETTAAEPLQIAAAATPYGRARPRVKLGSLGIPFAMAGPPIPPATYTFTLSPQPRPNGAAPGTWLPGTSTNYTRKSEVKAESTSGPLPDYIFERTSTLNTSLAAPSSNGLTITTQGDVTQTVTVVVTSNDFGGSAQLRGTAKLFNTTVTVDVVSDLTGMHNVTPPSRACGSDFAAHGPFASLPVDQDCNGIADSWEAPFAQTLLGSDHFPDPGVDMDRGAQGANTPANLLGDGLSVHDEYRGFHVLSAQTGQPIWVSTDPTYQDLFYWDADRIGRTSSDSVGQMIFNSVLGSTTQAFMALHAVDKLLANGNRGAVSTATKPKQSASPLNKNSIYLTQRKAYAVIYTNADLKPAGILGKSGDDFSIDFAFRNAGTPIFINQNAIATQERSRSFVPGALLSQVLAHETGHKLSREHPLRCAAPVAYNPAQALSLSIFALDPATGLLRGQFMQGGSDLLDFYVRYGIYSFSPPPADGIQKSDRIKTLSPTWTFKTDAATPSTGVTPPNWTYHVRVEAQGKRVNRTPFAELPIEMQESLLMDWTPDLRIVRTAGPWRWAGRDINALCLQPGGCAGPPSPPKQPWPSCSALW